MIARRSAPARAVLAAMAALCAFVQPAVAKAAAGTCAIHLWGAIPDYGPRPRFAAPGAPMGSPHADRSNPTANINTLDPVQRLRGVDDAVVKLLAPDAAEVAVIRHPDPLFIKRAGNAGVRLSPSTAFCYVDLVALELYDIHTEARWDPGVSLTGIVTAALAAPDGLHIGLMFRRFDGPGKPVRRARVGYVMPLAIGRPHWPFDPPATIAALDQSVALGIARLAKEKAQ